MVSYELVLLIRIVNAQRPEDRSVIPQGQLKAGLTEGEIHCLRPLSDVT